MSQDISDNPPISQEEEQKFLRSMRLSRMIFPILIGVVAVGYLFYYQFDAEKFREIHWSGTAFIWLGISLALLIARHFCYSYRLLVLTRGYFSYRKCLELMVLWEFSSALTPTSKGGPFVMLFVLTKEKLQAGKTATAVFYTMVLDSGFFVISLPLLLLIYGPSMLYPGMNSYQDVGLASGTFFVTFAMMLVYWAFMVFFLIINPKAANALLQWLARLPILKRFSEKLIFLGEEFSLAAREMRSQNWSYHVKVILATIGSWATKFLMINCIIIALVPSTPLDGATQVFIYARLVAMFIILTFSPTPGGAGLYEIALASFISDYVPAGVGMVVALIWRGMSYYGYLLLGAVVVPGWIASRLRKRTADVPA
ncbi:MAG: lysylphosphatidylglycerol synthase transmembrane domain-containing protein [Saprospiraceae bacterium]|nr:flippase-like domain-containing protein [Saprospiraceae bacterium]MCB9344905.1 flippase-like domain-containing protein [Lewinellaceae bacterium]